MFSIINITLTIFYYEADYKNKSTIAEFCLIFIFTILIVEQNVPMVFRMTEHCVIIENGHIVAEGSRKELESTNAMKDYLAV